MGGILKLTRAAALACLSLAPFCSRAIAQDYAKPLEENSLEQRRIKWGVENDFSSGHVWRGRGLAVPVESSQSFTKSHCLPPKERPNPAREEGVPITEEREASTLTDGYLHFGRRVPITHSQLSENV